jgi:hypothetical protein
MQFSFVKDSPSSSENIQSLIKKNFSLVCHGTNGQMCIFPVLIGGVRHDSCYQVKKFPFNIIKNYLHFRLKQITYESI